MSGYSDDLTGKYPPGRTDPDDNTYALRPIGFECMGVPLLGWTTPAQAEKAGKALREIVGIELQRLGFDKCGNPNPRQGRTTP